MFRHFLCLTTSLFLSIVAASSAFADKRIALVIGNGAYKNAPALPNPRNDANDVASALKRSGFETIVGLDLDRDGMEKSTISFARAARDADVAIFYYSGHAMQFNGINYLMPVDAKLSDEEDLRRMSRVDEIAADVQKAKNLRILVLDSCRDNPLAEQLKRSVGRTRDIRIQNGLAKMDAPQGMIVAYSTQSGRLAADGSGRNSPYTSAFLKHIEENDEIGTIFRRVSADVYNDTKGSQLPELSLSFIGEFYLKNRPTGAAVAAIPAPAPIVQPMSTEEIFWQSIKDSKVAAVFDEFLAKFPNSAHAREARNIKIALAPSIAPTPPPPTSSAPAPEKDDDGKDTRSLNERLSDMQAMFDRAARSRGYVPSEKAGIYQLGSCRMGLQALESFKEFDSSVKLATSRLVWAEGDKFFFVSLGAASATANQISPGRSVTLTEAGRISTFNVKFKTAREEMGFAGERIAVRSEGSSKWKLSFGRCPGSLETQRAAALTLVRDSDTKTSSNDRK